MRPDRWVDRDRGWPAATRLRTLEMERGDGWTETLALAGGLGEVLLRRALELMQREYRPATWRACWEQVVEGRPAAEVARELGLSVNAVYVARSRVLWRLREYLEHLLD